MRKANRCSPMILCLSGSLLLFTAHRATAQGTIGFSVNGGIAKVDFGGSAGTNHPIYGFGMAYTYGSGGARSSLVMSGGIQLYQTSADGNPTSGHVSIFEYRTPVTIGWSIANTGFGAYFDYRQGTRSADVANPGNYQAFSYGPYLRVGLGPRGSLPGKFALEGRYLWVSGTFTGVDGSYFGAFGTTQDFTMGSNSHDIRLGLSFTPTPKWVIRAEYHDLQYKVDTSVSQLASPGIIDQKTKAYLLTLGYVL